MYLPCAAAEAASDVGDAETPRLEQPNSATVLVVEDHPDVSAALDIWFSAERVGYFNNDPVILDAIAKGLRETDPVKRDAIYQVALDRNIDMHYVLPISSLPSVYAHSKDVKIFDDQLSATERFLGDFGFQ